MLLFYGKAPIVFAFLLLSSNLPSFMLVTLKQWFCDVLSKIKRKEISWICEPSVIFGELLCKEENDDLLFLWSE